MLSVLQAFSLAGFQPCSPDFVLSFLQDSYQACLRELPIACFPAVQQQCFHSGILSGVIAFLHSFRPSFYPSRRLDCLIAGCHAFRHSCALGFLHSCNLAGRITCHLECMPSARPEARAACLPACQHSGAKNSSNSIGCIAVAVFGVQRQHLALCHSATLS